ncbi:GIY-YIG nuclease family protein [Pectobacterium brasiliense]|uniref:GIY-YIG nuclease family protein n=1 Tax=Pectobacterium brasiliense TaxID=180957 RepID=UPI001968F7D0|nr:GIY-YIG nuclease family protein [Pectobacterium brasiliense]MBN3124555.1 GIY-YIG nuclease family protein [Pectobacterium brasiliense]QSD23542.1 GIY-YIG nuclease family protein [Pectobacterium brasiliense]
MIELESILHIENDLDYKVHFAVFNYEEEPLDVFVRDKSEWQGWNEWRNGRDDFNRKYIFSLIRFYPQKNRWLFGGIYEVLERRPDGYKVRLVNEHRGLIGRLLIDYPGPGARGRSFLFENHYFKMKVAEIFNNEYSGETFCGFDQVQHSFEKLEHIIKKQKIDWKRALLNVKGVYLIVDKSNGKKYVGSAYGEHGIWSRWETYVCTGHGWNEGLSDLLKEKGIDYARRNFQFSIMDFYSMRTDDQIILERESYWKRVLCSREFGYNRN